MIQTKTWFMKKSEPARQIWKTSIHLHTHHDLNVSAKHFSFFDKGQIKCQLNAIAKAQENFGGNF